MGNIHSYNNNNISNCCNNNMQHLCCNCNKVIYDYLMQALLWLRLLLCLCLQVHCPKTYHTN